MQKLLHLTLAILTGAGMSCSTVDNRGSNQKPSALEKRILEPWHDTHITLLRSDGTTNVIIGKVAEYEILWRQDGSGDPVRVVAFADPRTGFVLSDPSKDSA